MIQKINLNSVHTKVDEDIRKYALKKLGNLDKYIPSHSRKSAHMEIYLKQETPSDANAFKCEVTLHLPQQSIVIKEASINMYSAIDITEAKLKIQLKKYKETHTSSKEKRHIISRISKRNKS